MNIRICAFLRPVLSGIFLLCPGFLVSGEEPVLPVRHWSVQLGAGWNCGGYNEYVYSDCVQNVSAPVWNIQAQYTGEKIQHQIFASFYYDRPRSVLSDTAVLNEEYDPLTGTSYYSAENTQVVYYRGALSYRFLYRLWGTPQFPGFAGALVRSDVFVQFAHYPVITVAASFCPALAQCWIPDRRNTVRITLAVPVIGWALRPPYAGADGRMIQNASDGNIAGILADGGLTSLHNYQAVMVCAEWQHRVGSHLALILAGDVYLSRFSEPDERRTVDAVTRTEIAWYF